MRNLERYQQKVWNSKNLNGKKEAMKELIEDSHAKVMTKKKSLIKVERSKSMAEIDFFAANYGLAGEGLGMSNG